MSHGERFGDHSRSRTDRETAVSARIFGCPLSPWTDPRHLSAVSEIEIRQGDCHAVSFFLARKNKSNKNRERRIKSPSLKPSAVLLGIAGARSRGPHGLRTTGNKQAKKELNYDEVGFRVIECNKPILQAQNYSKTTGQITRGRPLR